MTGSIICGVDDSESAKGAVRVARALAGELQLGLTFVGIVESNARPREVAATREWLERLSDANGGAAWSVQAGHPADSLIAAAREADAALLVVGSTGPRSSLLGSISADVSRRAPCPVVVVPPGADERHRDGNELDNAGGIARLGLGEDGTDFAGGIARFNLGGS